MPIGTDDCFHNNDALFNLSMRGACIKTPERYDAGDMILLNFFFTRFIFKKESPDLLEKRMDRVEEIIKKMGKTSYPYLNVWMEEDKLKSYPEFKKQVQYLRTREGEGH